MFKTTACYISGAICGKLWMPAVMSGKTIQNSLRGAFGFMEKGDTFQDALWSLLMREGGDFQRPLFSADTVIRIERRKVEGPGKYRVNVKEIEIKNLPYCADMVNDEVYTGDFIND